jgi:hypothetical protein
MSERLKFSLLLILYGLAWMLAIAALPGFVVPAQGQEGGQYGFTWDANTEEDLARYELYQVIPTGKVPVASIAAPTTSISITIPPGPDRTYVLTAVDVAGNESGDSDPATANVPPVRPCGLLITRE